MKILSSGAEAVIYQDKLKVVKERIAKDYRIPEIDERLRAFRTRREAKILDRLASAGISAPRLLEMNDKAMTISMEFLDGQKLRDVINSNPSELSYEMGRLVGKLHSNDIVHQDLTTSNLMLKEDKLHLIDFGLSFFSPKIEDKAVDIHLLARALESRHCDIYDECFSAVLKGYREAYPGADEVLRQLEKVELRGRNKRK